MRFSVPILAARLKIDYGVPRRLGLSHARPFWFRFNAPVVQRACLYMNYQLMKNWRLGDTSGIQTAAAASLPRIGNKLTIK